jgi:hypothetical protein
MSAGSSNKTVEIIMKKVLVTAALMVASSSSLAAGGYAGFDLGWANADQEDSVRTVNQALANQTGSTSRATYDTGAAIGRIYGGWKSDNNFGVEVGYFASDDLDATYVSGGTTLTSAVSTDGFDLSGLVWIDDNIHLKAGVHSSDVDATLAGPGGQINGSSSGTGWLVGAGYDGAINESLSWRAGYTYYAKLGGDSDNTMHMFAVGINTKF